MRHARALIASRRLLNLPLSSSPVVTRTTTSREATEIGYFYGSSAFSGRSAKLACITDINGVNTAGKKRRSMRFGGNQAAALAAIRLMCYVHQAHLGDEASRFADLLSVS